MMHNNIWTRSEVVNNEYDETIEGVILSYARYMNPSAINVEPIDESQRKLFTEVISLGRVFFY